MYPFSLFQSHSLDILYIMITITIDQHDSYWLLRLYYQQPHHAIHRLIILLVEEEIAGTD